MWTHWRHLANMTELVLPSVHPSSQSKRKSIGSAVLAQLTAENPYIYNGFFLPQNFSSDWVSGPQLIHGSCVSLSRKPKRRVDRFSHFCIDDRRVSLYFTMGRPSPLKIAPSHGGSGPTWFPGLTRGLNLSSISIGSADFCRAH